jgi:hypothetical protein
VEGEIGTKGAQATESAVRRKAIIEEIASSGATAKKGAQIISESKEAVRKGTTGHCPSRHTPCFRQPSCVEGEAFTLWRRCWCRLLQMGQSRLRR